LGLPAAFGFLADLGAEEDLPAASAFAAFFAALFTGFPGLPVFKDFAAGAGTLEVAAASAESATGCAIFFAFFSEVMSFSLQVVNVYVCQQLRYHPRGTRDIAVSLKTMLMSFSHLCRLRCIRLGTGNIR
jgi:hypothetical protein